MQSMHRIQKPSGGVCDNHGDGEDSSQELVAMRGPVSRTFETNESKTNTLHGILVHERIVSGFDAPQHTSSDASQRLQLSLPAGSAAISRIQTKDRVAQGDDAMRQTSRCLTPLTLRRP